MSILCDRTRKTRKMLMFSSWSIPQEGSPILETSIQDFMVSTRGTLVSLDSFQGAIQFNVIILSWGACFVLASLCEANIHGIFLSERRWFTRRFLICLEGSLSLTLHLTVPKKDLSSLCPWWALAMLMFHRISLYLYIPRGGFYPFMLHEFHLSDVPRDDP